MQLDALGWSAAMSTAFAPYEDQGYRPARVVSEHQHLYRVAGPEGERLASVSGRFRHNITNRASYPAVGDWVAVEDRPEDARALIQAVLPRRSKFSRKVAGDTTEEQVVAANVDVVFLVAGLDRDFNARRLERYVVTAFEGGATPVIVLNKTDMCDRTEACVTEARALAPGVDVVAVSCHTREGLPALEAYLSPARTIALLGSSGAGKSTLINRFVGHELRRTSEVRERDSRGRHTTTHRELINLETGALLIDTPGMRELQLWEGTERMDDAFDDIAALAAGCFFRDCQHAGEPKCAVKAAAAAGLVASTRLDHYLRLQRELKHLAVQQDLRAQADAKRKTKIVHRALRPHKPRT